MILRNVSIGARLAAGFGTVLVVMLGASVAATYLGTKGRDEFAAVVARAGAKEHLAEEIKAIALEQSAVMRNIGLHADLMPGNLLVAIRPRSGDTPRTRRAAAARSCQRR